MSAPRGPALQNRASLWSAPVCRGAQALPLCWKHAARNVPAVRSGAECMDNSRARNMVFHVAAEAYETDMQKSEGAKTVVVEEGSSETDALAKKLRIKLKAFEVPLIQEAVQMIMDVAATTGAEVSGPVPLPTRRKLYCVLRSPHVNKDSREHFEIKIHKRLIDIKNLSAQTLDRLMELDIPAGVEASVKLL